jgi:colanic acid biosynthesis glycosyl transferase WcaI
MNRRVTPELAGRHLLMVGIYYRPEETGVAAYTTALAEHLVVRGMRVTVLCGMPHYPRWRVFDGYERRLKYSEVLDGVEVRRIRTFIPKEQSALRRAVYEGTSGAHVLSLRKSLRPDAILGVVPNLTGGVVAAVAGRRYKRPFGLWVQDLTGPAAEQSGIKGGSGKIARLTSSVEGRTLRSALRIGIVSEGFRPYLNSQGVEADRVRFVPNWSHVPAANKNREAVRAELGWDSEEQVVLHAGNMGLKQGLEEVVRAASSLGGGSRVRFAFLGDGNQRKKLEGLARGTAANVAFIDPLPEQDFVNVLNAADVLLLSERASVSDMSLPSKLTSYFLAGRPVLAAVSMEGATARLLQETGSALVVPAADHESLAAALNRLRTDPELCLALTRRAARFAEANLSAPASLAKMEDIVSDLLAGPRSGAAAEEEVGLD